VDRSEVHSLLLDNDGPLPWLCCGARDSLLGGDRRFLEKFEESIIWYLVVSEPLFPLELQVVSSVLLKLPVQGLIMLDGRTLRFLTLGESILRQHLYCPKVVVRSDIVIVLGLSLASFRKFLNLLLHIPEVFLKSCIQFESLLLLFIMAPAVAEAALLLLEMVRNCLRWLLFLTLKEISLFNVIGY